MITIDLTVWCTGFPSLSDHPKKHTDTESLIAVVQSDGVINGRLPEGWTVNDEADEAFCPACSKRATKRGVRP